MRNVLAVAVALCLWQTVSAFVSPNNKLGIARHDENTATSLSMLNTVFSPSETSKSNENGLDDDYPWCFTGRLLFRPALVRVQDSNTLPESISVLSLFGYTLGGTVALEYDTSPVGPYREYVSMGALVVCAKGGMVGQWGSRLYVSTKTAEQICQKVWGVPAEVANIDFTENGPIQVKSAPDPLSTKSKPNIEVTGWSKTRVSDENAPVRGGIPILWTPTIKALWLKVLPVPLWDSSEGGLPVHRLRLSASSLSLQLCGQESSDLLGIPLPIGLSIDNVLIEIGREEGVL